MPGLRRRDGVVEQVADRLLHLVLVERERRRRASPRRAIVTPRGVAARRAQSADALGHHLARRVRIEVERAVLPEAQQLLDDAVGLVDAREDARRVLACGAGLGAASEQMRVHADGAVMPRPPGGRRSPPSARSSPGAGGARARPRGEQLLAPPLALQARVVEPLQDGVQRERRQAGGGEAGQPAARAQASTR